ncbi:hypothetical protein [Xanthomonas sp. 1678]|uniref:hypothetical protein n=1 Tax=Xanthomonas sp. 1678 TaxID=3158788 RepID=UPI0028568882|nr:rubredoxin [Xanthomonas translucens]
MGRTHAKKIKNRARRLGARFRSSRVRLKDLERKKVSWLSKKILTSMGVPAKPGPGSICPRCGAASAAFELDHMGPWRQYVAAMAGPHLINGKIKLSYVRALYNDPENLWWICRSCNGRKSDYISEDGSFPVSGVRGRDVDLDDIAS